MQKTRRIMRVKIAEVGADFHADYKDVTVLRKFMSERGKILARSKTGLTSKQQRKLTTAIKRARHLALLPFVVRT